jgi:hypothetical protein
MRSLAAPVAAFVLLLVAAAPAGAARLSIQTFDVPPGTPAWIAPGPDGNLWFTNDNSGNYIGRVTPGGKVTAFPVLTPSANPDTIVRGPDGAMWYTLRNGNKIGRITPSGQITEFPVPSPFSGPRGIAPGPDGALWFTEFNGGRIGRITTAGAITEYPIPGGGLPVSIVRGPDGNMWFTAPSLDSLGRITPAGAITLFNASNASGPESLVVGARQGAVVHRRRRRPHRPHDHFGEAAGVPERDHPRSEPVTHHVRPGRGAVVHGAREGSRGTHHDPREGDRVQDRGGGRARGASPPDRTSGSGSRKAAATRSAASARPICRESRER